MDSKEKIKHIVKEGTNADKIKLYSFSSKDSNEMVVKKFLIFARVNYLRYFKVESPEFHKAMILNLVKSYRGENYINLAFRGSSKTSLAKLFIVFVLLNDNDHYRKYIKILSRDLKNPRQIVTDVYNMILEVRYIYGDVFEKEGDKKREETMASFTLVSGVKLTAGTVGQTQRGHVQDAYRPDWLLFDDVEDRESVSSATITEGIILRCDEAITGLAQGGSWCVLGNYISENGVIQWFINKSERILQVTPIAVDGVPTWGVFTVEKIEQLKKDSLDFYGEYMCDPSRSDGKFFDVDRIENDIRNVRSPDRIFNNTKYWQGFIQHHRYGMGADTSEGVGRDSSALAVFNFRTGDLVATYDSNQVSPELFAYEMVRVAGEYGSCVLAPEINNMSGGIVISTLKAIPYNNIYRQVDKLRVQEVESTKYGWHTNSRTKPQMFMDFRRDYNDGIIHIFDERVLKEMKSYSVTDLSETTGLTRHFDLLTAVVIAWQMKDVDNLKGVTVTYHQY